MSTVCGSGGSTAESTDEAVRSAVERALAKMEGAAPSVGLLFASPRHPLDAALSTARAAAPDAEWIGCSTAGEITEAGRTDGGVAVFLAAWDEARQLVTPVLALREDVAGLAKAMCEGYPALIEHAIAMGWPHSATFVLGDGLSPRFEQLVTEIRRATRVHHTVVGGGAADDGALETNWVGSGREAKREAAVALHIASKRRWGVGVGQGAEASSERMTVTRASGNVVHEIDGRPTLEVYRAWAEARGEALPDDLGMFLVRNELGIYFFDDIVRVRAGIGVTDEGAVVCAGEVPEGASVAIVRGEPEQLLRAARSAAEQALADIDGPAAGVLVISCITRGLVLGDRFGEEIEAVVDVFGRGVPVAGFLSYGEVARVRGKLDGYHNHTIVVAAIPE